MKLGDSAQKMSQMLKEFCTAPRMRITNFVTYGLIILGVILRAIVSDEADEGVGGTPVFLYIVQLLLSIVFVGMLICGELHKPVAILMCFPLVMSRVGRGVIIIILALPVTNFYDFSTALIMIITTVIGAVNIYIGFNDGPILLKYAQEGMPEDNGAGGVGNPGGAVPGQSGQNPPPRAEQYEMQQMGAA